MIAYSLGWQQKERCTWNQNAGVGGQPCPCQLRLGFVDCFSVLLSQTFFIFYFGGWGGNPLKSFILNTFVMASDSMAACHCYVVIVLFFNLDSAKSKNGLRKVLLDSK